MNMIFISFWLNPSDWFYFIMQSLTLQHHRMCQQAGYLLRLFVSTCSVQPWHFLQLIFSVLHYDKILQTCIVEIFSAHSCGPPKILSEGYCSWSLLGHIPPAASQCDHLWKKCINTLMQNMLIILTKALSEFYGLFGSFREWIQII